MLAAALALAPAAATAEEDGAPPGDPILAEFRRQFRGPSPERKAAAFRLLDATTASCLPPIYDGFRERHWLVRGAAAEAAARVPDGPLRFQLRLDLLGHAEDAVRSGLAYALALAPLPGDGEALAGALSDRAPEARRDAARGLKRVGSRAAVEALIAALRREPEARVRVWILDTLRGIAREDPGPAAEDWDAWWTRHREDPAFLPAEDAKAERGDFAGVPLEVVTVPGRPSRGGGDDAVRRPELFVLAPFGWTHDWFRPHLDALGDVFSVSYIDLPSVQELTGQSGYGSEIAVYPVGRLARAFEALREARGVDRVVLLAEGAACWIAEAYAVLYPKRAAGLVLVNGWLDAPSYSAALARFARSDDADERAVADSLRGVSPGARDRAEDRWIGRTMLTHSLLDRGDLLGHHLWNRARDPQGFATVPAVTFDRRHPIETPALFVFPGGSAFSGHLEASRVRDVFPQGLVATMDDTRGLPFADRHDDFHRVVRGFVARYHLDR